MPPSSSNRLIPVLMLIGMSSAVDAVAAGIRLGGQEVQASVSAESGIKPEYHLDSGGYLQTGISLGWRPNLPVALSVRQVMTTVDTAEAPKKAGTRPEDTLGSVSLAEPLHIAPIKADLGLAFGGVVYAGSDLSVHRGVRGRLGPTLKLSIARGRWTNEMNAGYGKYLNRTTRRPEGSANVDYRYQTGISVGYDLPFKLNIAASYTSFHYVNYDDASNFYYAANTELSRAQTDRLSLAVGLTTEDTELKDGRSAPVYLYKEDLSNVYLGANFKI